MCNIVFYTPLTQVNKLQEEIYDKRSMQLRIQVISDVNLLCTSIFQQGTMLNSKIKHSLNQQNTFSKTINIKPSRKYRNISNLIICIELFCIAQVQIHLYPFFISHIMRYIMTVHLYKTKFLNGGYTAWICSRNNETFSRNNKICFAK